MKTACIEWKGRRNASGYGVVLINGKQQFVHRLAVALSGRNIPKTKVCDHLCRNHACYNPEHLELVSIGENALRGVSPPALAAKRDTCSHGHKLTTGSENTRLHKDKEGRITRHCRTCYARRQHEYRRRNGRPLRPARSTYDYKY